MQRPSYSLGGFGPLGSTAIPRDIAILLVVVFVTFSLQFFASTSLLIELLRLSPAVWQRGFLWQLLTYPFIGAGGPSPWILLELLVLYWFASSVRARLGQRRFWRLMAIGTLVGAAVAVGTALVFGASPLGVPAFALMQGQRMLTTLVIAGFALLFRDATIMLMFVLPIRASWFLPLELLIAFIAFLATKDLPGLLGIYAGVAAVWLTLSPVPLSRQLREARLRMERWWLGRRLARMQRQRGMRVVRGGRPGGDGPFVH